MEIRQPLTVATLAFATGMLFSACGAVPDDDDATPAPGEDSAEVIATEYQFNPSQIMTAAGADLTVTLVNQGQEAHNIEFELPDGVEALSADVPAGQSGSFTFEVPDEPGNYTFYCPIGQHFQLGMEGVLVVE